MLSAFSTEALILFPKEINSEPRYSNIFFLSVRKYCAYLQKEGVTVYAFNTDPLAIEVTVDNLKFYNPLSEADEFFAKNNCVGMAGMPKGIRLKKEIDEAFKKFPNQRGLTREQRFDLLQKREKAAVREFLKTYKFVTNFGKGKSRNYKSDSKADDGVLRVQVDPNSLMITPYLSGKQLPVYDIFDFVGSGRPLYQWEVM